MSIISYIHAQASNDHVVTVIALRHSVFHIHFYDYETATTYNPPGQILSASLKLFRKQEISMDHPIKKFLSRENVWNTFQSFSEVFHSL